MVFQPSLIEDMLYDVVSLTQADENDKLTFYRGKLKIMAPDGSIVAHFSDDEYLDYVAEHAYTMTLAVSLGQIKTLIENPYSMTHSSYAAAKQAGGDGLESGNRGQGVEPGGIRLSIGLEDRHDIIADLEQALAHC